MKRLFLLFIIILPFCGLGTFAQRNITGTLLDKDTGEGMAEAAIQLLKADSTFVTGTVASDKGEFTLAVPQTGKYILRITNVGYKNLCKNILVKSDEDLSLGRIQMKADAIMLKGAQVTAQAAKVTVRADTFVYNASAYRTPEGSVVEELVKKLPGAQVDDDGKITINGKEVKKILVDGKEFMTGDTQTAMKNLPTTMINDIKAYDQKSDLARISGIDDGEEQTVLDFGIKKGMNQGIFGNLDGSYGTRSRYAFRGMGAYFTSKSRLMTFLNFNNTNDMGFPGGGPGGRWGNREGLNTKKMVGVNYNYEDKGKLKIDLSARWNRTDGDIQKTTDTENFVSSTGAFTSAKTLNFTRQNRFNFRGRLEWQVDSMVTLMFRPTATLQWNDGTVQNYSSSYRKDPYSIEGVTDPWAKSTVAEVARIYASDSLAVNYQGNNSISYSRSTSVGGKAELNWKLNRRGRNITLSEDASYTDSPSKTISASEVTLYQIKSAQLNSDGSSNDSTYYTNRYNVTPQKSWSTATKFTYTEPLARKLYLQIGYQFQYKHTTSDRTTYDYSGYRKGQNPWEGLTPAYRDWDNYLGRVSNWESYRCDSLCKYSEYNNYIHNIELMLRFVREKFKLNVGVLYQPQNSTLKYRYLNTDTIVKRFVQNITPTLDLRYQPNKVTQLRLEYRGSTSQPSMTDLLPITDNSNPMNITMGNPDLKPSFTNNLRGHFNTFLQNHQQAMMTFINYSQTRNAVANMVQYNSATGGMTTRPENINGNWNINWGGMYNCSIDSAGVWNMNIFTMLTYNNYVGYLYQQQTRESVRNTTRSTMVMPRLQASFRKSWGEIGVDGSLTYTHTRNELQPQSNLDTWQFSYGGSINLYAPWGTSFSTDLHNQCRRGYSDNSMNTNELVWNAQISHSFLKGKPLTVSLQWYDILGQQSAYSRTISAMSRVDTQSNAINSYGMLKVTYRFNLMGGKKAREKMESEFPGPPGMRHGDRDRGGRPPMGPPPGHF